MARVPGFQEIERFGASHFADQDAVGTKPQSGPEQAAQTGRLAAPKQDRVGARALDLGGVLENDEPVLGKGGAHLRDDGVDERGLSGARAAHDEDVLRLAAAHSMTAFWPSLMMPAAT